MARRGYLIISIFVVAMAVVLMKQKFFFFFFNETKVNIYTAIKSYDKKYSSSAPGSIHKINWPKYR